MSRAAYISRKDSEAVEAYKNHGYEYPSIAGWMRLIYEDPKLVKGSKV
jgi:hypothetical protein